MAEVAVSVLDIDEKDAVDYFCNIEKIGRVSCRERV